MEYLLKRLRRWRNLGEIKNNVGIQLCEIKKAKGSIMNDLKDLYIIGSGGFGREVAWLVERINENRKEWNIKGFIDDDVKTHGAEIDNYPVLGDCEYLLGRSKNPNVYAVCAVGSAIVRKKIINKLDCNVRFATVIDPSVILSRRVTIGDGTIICAGNIITVDVSIGKHVILNLDCTVGHDVVLNDFITVYPSVNISGNVTIGECSEIGTGTQIIQGKKICDEVIVGAGAVVVKDIEEAGVYTGIPVSRKR